LRTFFPSRNDSRSKMAGGELRLGILAIYMGTIILNCPEGVKRNRTDITADMSLNGRPRGARRRLSADASACYMGTDSKKPTAFFVEEITLPTGELQAIGRAVSETVQCRHAPERLSFGERGRRRMSGRREGREILGKIRIPRELNLVTRN